MTVKRVVDEAAVTELAVLINGGLSNMVWGLGVANETIPEFGEGKPA